MSEHILGKSYSQFVNVLVFIFPVVINSVKVAGDIVLFILAVMGIFIAISKRLSPFSIKETRVFSYLTSGYFLAVCLSVLFSGKAMELAHFISRDLHFLFAPFIALAFYKAEININYLLTGVKVGLIVLGVIVINQSGFSLTVSHRPTGVMNANLFAMLAASMLFVVIAFINQETFKHKAFTLLSLLSGIFVIVLSGTRGAWLTVFLLLVVYVFFLYKQRTKLENSSKVFIALVIVTVLSIGSLNQYVNDRVHSAYTEVSSWLSDGKVRGPIRQRLEMYSYGIDNAEDVPFFFGHGYRTSNSIIGMSQNHLHNAYLTSYYNGGIVLLGALLLLLFVPLRIFIRAIRQNRDEPVLMAGTLLILGFVSHGMFGVLMGDVFMNAFYVFFLAIFLHLTAKLTKTS